MNLVAQLQAMDLEVVVHEGWQKRGKPGFYPKGVLIHHTGGAYTAPGLPLMPSLGTVMNGRPDLSPPLCHAFIDRNGRVHMIAGRRANHAGKCSKQAIAEIMSGLHGRTTRTALDRKLPDDASGINSGNVRLWGIEVEHCGLPKEAWRPVMVESTCRTAAALCILSNWDAGHVSEHRLITSRKIDPVGHNDWWSSIAALIKEYT